MQRDKNNREKLGKFNDLGNRAITFSITPGSFWNGMQWDWIYAKKINVHSLELWNRLKNIEVLMLMRWKMLYVNLTYMQTFKLMQALLGLLKLVDLLLGFTTKEKSS